MKNHAERQNSFLFCSTTGFIEASDLYHIINELGVLLNESDVLFYSIAGYIATSDLHHILSIKPERTSLWFYSILSYPILLYSRLYRSLRPPSHNE